MTRRRSDVVRLSSPADLICMVPRLLGFVPAESLVVICLKGERRKVGLAMRFDLSDVTDLGGFAEMVDWRVRAEKADSAFVVVFTTADGDGGELPGAGLADALSDRMGERLADVVLSRADRWWSYHCAEACCGGSTGTPIDPATPGAMAIAAAYALAGQGVLPDREAVVRSVALELTAAEAATMRGRVEMFAAQYADTSQEARRLVASALAKRFMDRLADPRGVLSVDDVAELAALCDDVVARDEVLVRAIGRSSRKRMLPVLREMARRVPPPLDAPVCAMLAWVAYADGDGVVANVAIERSLSTDPDYSLAGLIEDALYRQVPPHMLEEVMRGAARDLRHRSEAG